MFDEKYNNLNGQQKKAVDTIDGPVLVIAGPGSGKTELLSVRVGNILRKTDTLPSSILLLTFTESAAYNMRDRLTKLIGEQAHRVGIFTFHALATDILNRYSGVFWNGAKFLPATEVDQYSIIEEIVKNLPRKNSLSSFHPEQGYVYIKDILNAIGDLKKGNFTPESFRIKLLENKKNIKELKNVLAPLEELGTKRKISELLPAYIQIYQKLEKLISSNEISKILFNSLGVAINSANELEKSTPLTAWKNNNTKKTESGKVILKDEEESKISKLESLGDVYELYQEELYKRAIFDFEDMILMVNKGLVENGELRADLQEKFQYVMIDEFQDTNDAQFELVKNLTAAIVNEGRPNVFAVGDDDQAIFKFQGAELNNILNFKNMFKDVEIIVLDKNYRSTQNILDFSEKVISKANTRLVNKFKDIKKEFFSENKTLPEGEIIQESFNSEILEFDYVTKEISKLISNGINPKEIAVICRKHLQLKTLANVLNSYKVPYSYEKKENVLDKQHIREILVILKYINSVNNGAGDEYLPEILSFKFWGLKSIDVWKIAEKIKNSPEKISWLEAMLNSENVTIKNISEFIIHLTVISKSTPLEYLIDEIIGTTEFLWEDSEHDDALLVPKQSYTTYTSPFKKYYFNNENFEHNKPFYLDFLFSLRTFIGALREFHQGKVLFISDIIDFINIYNGQNLTLSVISPFSSSSEAVSLLTAHKAKGLEFEYVFLLSSDDDVWKKSGFARKISFPINMPLTVESDNDDDKIRLLYVALTRTKHTLYITNNSQKLEYLLEESNGTVPPPLQGRGNTQGTDREGGGITREAIDSLNISPRREFVSDEKVLLMRVLENYKMPITHMNNFLNFTRVGPARFVEQNLLRFPQAITPSSAYGSAMHEAVEKYFMGYNKSLKRPEYNFLLQAFEKKLERSRLPEYEYKKYLKDGQINLKKYFEYINIKPILPNTKVETKFSNEGVMIGEVKATGNIDRMEFVGGNEIIVTDIKTGESYTSFEEKGLGDYEKIKLHFYKYQLVYYALLIKNSRSFNSYKVKVGNIEFLEEDRNQKINVVPLVIDEELLKKVEALANIVYLKIMDLDFPKVDHYPQNMKGILQFEEDLLNNKI